MRDGVLKTKLRAAELSARELGLMPRWTEEFLEVTLKEEIIHEDDEALEKAALALVSFLTTVVDREPKTKFVSNDTVEVNGEQIKAKSIIIATGSTPIVPAAWQDFADDVITSPFQMTPTMKVPESPGLGVELDEEKLKRYMEKEITEGWTTRSTPVEIPVPPPRFWL